MAWQCIAGGANGLIFYSWMDLWRVRDLDPFEARWADVTRMAAEIREQMPVLLSVDPVPAVQTADAPAAVAWRLFAHEGRVCVLVVNSGDQPARAALTFATGVREASDRLGRGDRTATGRRLEVDLAPLDVRLVSFVAAP